MASERNKGSGEAKRSREKTDAQEKQERRVKAQGGTKKKKEQREKRALKKEKKRILCKKITTCRIDT